MVFSSIEFVVFFALVCFLLMITNLKILYKKLGVSKLIKLRHALLLVASYIFYGWWDFKFCFLMLLLSFIAFISVFCISKQFHVKLFKAIGIVFPLVILGIFKYFNFFLENISTLLNIENLGTLNIILPVGISFYTFQSMSYTIDFIRGKQKQQSFFNVALYISFFPQLVAGPIVKSEEFMHQLEDDRNISVKNVSEGLQIFLFGLFKKIVIADNISVFVDRVFESPLSFHSLTVILAVISYSIQIYLDFSGYSDMAVGAARCLGYHFNRNFNIPYISRNVTEFWKRWHISLSSWLQEYLYIPLGGNRKGTTRTYINLLITMILGGLWHGASWNFVLWGFLHGIALCIHKLYVKHIKKDRQEKPFTILLSSVFTYIFVCICWIFFRASDITTALSVLSRMFLWSEGVLHIYTWSLFGILSTVAATFYGCKKFKGENNQLNGGYLILDMRKFSSQLCFILFAGLILILAYTGANPFIYFQF